MSIVNGLSTVGVDLVAHRGSPFLIPARNRNRVQDDSRNRVEGVRLSINVPTSRFQGISLSRLADRKIRNSATPSTAVAVSVPDKVALFGLFARSIVTSSSNSRRPGCRWHPRPLRTAEQGNDEPAMTLGGIGERTNCVAAGGVAVVTVPSVSGPLCVPSEASVPSLPRQSAGSILARKIFSASSAGSRRTRQSPPTTLQSTADGCAEGGGGRGDEDTATEAAPPYSTAATIAAVAPQA